MFDKIKHNKFPLIILIVIFSVTTLYIIFSSKMAGYNYLKYTNTQMEIILENTEWDKRTIIKDKEQINAVLSIISDAALEDDSNINCNLQESDFRLLIRRNFAKTVLSWEVCRGEKDTYLVPLLSKEGMVVYKADIQLMSKIEDIINVNK